MSTSAEYQAPPNVNYSYKGKATEELLASGEIGAAVGDIRRDAPGIKPLIPDARNAGIAFFRRTGIYPLNHCLVIRNEILDAEPWVAEELFDAFTAAEEELPCAGLDQGVDLSPADEAAISLGRAVGGDPFPLGVNANRKALEAIVQFAFDQQTDAQKTESRRAVHAKHAKLRIGPPLLRGPLAGPQKKKIFSPL